MLDRSAGAQRLAGLEPVLEVMAVVLAILQPEVIGVFANGRLVRAERGRAINQGFG